MKRVCGLMLFCFGAGMAILLFIPHAPLVPFFPIFATPSQIGHGKYASILQEENARCAEEGSHGLIESTIGIEKTGIIPVKDQSFLMDQEHRDRCAVLALIDHLRLFEIIRIELQVDSKKDITCARGDIVEEDRTRVNKRGIGVKQLIVISFSGKSTGSAKSRKMDFRFAGAIRLISKDPGCGIVQITGKQIATTGGHAFQ